MLKNIGINEDFEGTFLVEKVDIGTAKNGKQFASVVIRDKHSSVPGKVWGYTHDSMGTLLKAGNVLTISATMSEYRGERQATIFAMAASSADPSDFARSTSMDVEEMYAEVLETIENFQEPLTKHIAKHLLTASTIVSSFKRSPAATGVHNNWVGGLLEHVWSMLQIAKGVCEHYQSYLKVPFSRDKVLFGVIFHDIGKTVEYDQTNPAFEKTPLGFLANHIVLGPAWVFHSAQSFPKEARDALGEDRFILERAKLMHMVASHHGSQEWGSPVSPATLEAIILHHIDNLDSKVMHATDLLKSALEKDDAAEASEYSRLERVKYIP